MALDPVQVFAEAPSLTFTLALGESTVRIDATTLIGVLSTGMARLDDHPDTKALLRYLRSAIQQGIDDTVRSLGHQVQNSTMGQKP